MTVIADPLTYDEALAAIADRGRFGIHLGLGRVRALLRAMGDPQDGIRGALIAGTNGKGSVLALTGAALRAAGLRVGETPKPHLVTYRERLVVDGRPVQADVFARLVAEVLVAVDRVPSRLGPPTEFEILTAVTFRWFAEQRLDVALVEVGLGGRLDATHAWDGGVAVVTNVDLDHQDRLGATIPLIAKEKAAIIERGDVAVTGATGDALTVVRRRARRVAAPLTEVGPAPLLGWDRDRIQVELPSLGATWVGLRGRHQAANVAVADATLDALEAAGIAHADEAARREGYAAVRWPGRLERLERDGRELLLDGAHNPAGAAALAGALDDLRPFLHPGSVTLLTASMADKDVRGVVAALAGAAALGGVTVVCVAVGLPRALPAVELAALWRDALPTGARVAVAGSVADGLAIALAEGTGPIVVAGSLYLVGEVRGTLTGETGP